MNAIACGGCAPPVYFETERQADQRVADELRAARAASVAPYAPADVAMLVAAAQNATVADRAGMLRDAHMVRLHAALVPFGVAA
jgi:hypothetical protein